MLCHCFMCFSKPRVEDRLLQNIGDGKGMYLLKMQMSRPCPRFSPLRISVLTFIFLTCTSWFCTLKLGSGGHCSVPGFAVSPSQTNSFHHILVNMRLKKQKRLGKAPGFWTSLVPSARDLYVSGQLESKLWDNEKQISRNSFKEL